MNALQQRAYWGSAKVIEFGEFELDAAAFELRRRGKRVAIQPQLIELLAFLIDNRERVVERGELVQAVWGGRFVSDQTISSRINALRSLLGDSARDPTLIKTVHRRGFRFIGKVRRSSAAARSEPPAQPSEAAAPRGKPAIAVLPFRLVGVAGPHAAFAEALPADIITALSRLRWLLVIARASSFLYGAKSLDLARLRDDLAVGFALTGTVEILGNRLKAWVELADTRSRSVVWSDNLAIDLEEIHDAREQIARTVASHVEEGIVDAEATRARLIAPSELGAWEAYHLGMAALLDPLGPRMAHGQELFERAVAADPQFSRAHAGVARAIDMQIYNAAGTDVEVAFAQLRRSARKAIESDALDPFANVMQGFAHRSGGDFVQARRLIERAIELSPNYAFAHSALGSTAYLTGRLVEAFERTGHALLLDPRNRTNFETDSIHALAALELGHEDAALASARRLVARPTDSPLGLTSAAVVLHCCGDSEQARHAVRRLSKVDPNQVREAALKMPSSLGGIQEKVLTTLAAYSFGMRD